MQDLRYACRQIRKSPGFTLAAVLSLALGIGANTAIFQLVDAIRLKMLPVRDAPELAKITFSKGSIRSGNVSTRSGQFTSAQWDTIRAQQQAFRGLLAWSATRFNLSPGGEARYAEGQYVSGEFFSLLDVDPMIGRTFTAQDDNAACSSPGTVISYAFWQREFGGAANVLSRTVSLDGHAVPVIGVTGPQFFGVEVGRQYDVAVPLCVDRLFSEDGVGRAGHRNHWWLSIMGRMKPGWNLALTTAQLRAVSPWIMQATLPPTYKADTAKQYLEKNKLEATEGATGVSGLRNQYQQALWLLMAATGLVLLIACANLANLLLARASVREREIAVRLAIGSSRARLVRQLLIESMLLAAAGAILGAGLASALSRALVAFISTNGTQWVLNTGLDWRTLGFTGGLAVLTCVLFGLTPALRATHFSPAVAIRGMGRSVTSNRQRVTLRRLLVATQVALSLVLLTGSILFVRSLRNLLTTEAGFNPEGAVTVDIDFARASYPKERRIAIYKELHDHIAAIPGVADVGQVGFTPISGSGWNENVGPDDTPAATSNKLSYFDWAGPGYFRTMGTALIAGRDFDERDRVGSPKVAIVNETFARKFFGGINPVGHTFRLEAPRGRPEPLIQIVGLVKNTKYYDLHEEFYPIGFFPPAQDEDPDAHATFVVRQRGASGQFLNSVKSTIAQMSPSIDIEFGSMSIQVQDSLLRERLMATLSGAFAGLAALLATLGLYSVIAYMVVRRRNEIGVRIALGAARHQVIRLVLCEALMLLGVGLAIGIAMSVAAGRAATALLYGIKPHDPVSVGVAVALLSVITIAAAYAPARRAAGLEPSIALRDDG
jgi:predicted permease